MAWSRWKAISCFNRGTEGESLQPIMADPTGTHDSRPAAFMQYAHCMHDEGVPAWGHDGCKQPDEPKVMGYVIRTRRYRYIEWVRFNKSAPTGAMAQWDQVLGTELYDHTESDSVENGVEAANVVAQPAYKQAVEALSKQLRAGWRAAKGQ